MRLLALYLLTNIVQYVGSQILGPSLWGWGYSLESNMISGIMYNDSTIPHQRDYSKEVPSACSNNNDPNKGFACPHLLMFSSDMLLAAQRDGLGDSFFYGTAATSTDSECGKCYQVRVTDALTKWNETLAQRHVILQITNSGFDVVAGQYDVYMAAGGFGYYTACNKDCNSHFCKGGPSPVGMFEGSFEQWNRDKGYDTCYSGGLNLVAEDDPEQIWTKCGGLTNGFTQQMVSFKNDVLYQSCWYSNLLLYHQNFLSTDSVRVKCPDGLGLLTGLKRNDENGLLEPNLANTLPIQCRQRACFTNYQDCCKMSCSWNYKGSPDSVFGRIDTCDSEGLIIGYDGSLH